MARAIVGAVTTATAIVASRIVGSATTTTVGGLVVGTALAGGGGVIGTTTAADVTGRIIAATALADMASGIVGTAALAGLGSWNGKGRGKNGANQRKAGNLRHDLSPITIVRPGGRTEGKRRRSNLIPAHLKKVAWPLKDAE